MTDFKVGDVVVWNSMGRKSIGVINRFSVLHKQCVFVLKEDWENPLDISEIRHANPEEKEEFYRMSEVKKYKDGKDGENADD